MRRTVVIVPLDRSPYPRSFLDALNGYMTGGSGRCLESLLEAGAHVTTMPASPTEDGGGWRDISTAPKDGTLVLLGSRDEQAVGKWNSWPRGGGGWWVDAETRWDEDWPTHWRPLPEPPRSSDGGV